MGKLLQIDHWWILVLVLAITGCDSVILEPDNSDETDHPYEPDHPYEFPPFITPAEKYFKLQIAGNHTIDGDSYKLHISGGVDHPASYSLEELRNLEMIEKTLTVECIENPPNGSLLGTAEWKGFSVYDLLKKSGIKDGVTFVKYICSDGYFTYNTLEELQNTEVLGALYMNGEPIPANYGFPLRVLFPGYYGVRQPGWVVEMELLGGGIKDFWGETQFEIWNTDSAMAVDTKIFFPTNKDTLVLGESFRIGGAAYGCRRVSAVEITVDNGRTWIPATIKQGVDQDYVWIFWEVEYAPQSAGSLTIRARAKSEDGMFQPREDNNYLDGTNAWPGATVFVKDPG